MRNDDMPTPKKDLSALKSIRFYCRYLCCAGDVISWRHCSAVKCCLHKYRMGKGNRVKTDKTNEKPIYKAPFQLKNEGLNPSEQEESNENSN